MNARFVLIDGEPTAVAVSALDARLPQETLETLTQLMRADPVALRGCVVALVTLSPRGLEIIYRVEHLN